MNQKKQHPDVGIVARKQCLQMFALGSQVPSKLQATWPEMQANGSLEGARYGNCGVSAARVPFLRGREMFIWFERNMTKKLRLDWFVYAFEGRFLRGCCLGLEPDGLPFCGWRPRGLAARAISQARTGRPFLVDPSHHRTGRGRLLFMTIPPSSLETCHWPSLPGDPLCSCVNPSKASCGWLSGPVRCSIFRSARSLMYLPVFRICS